MPRHLVIVESPAKAKTIHRYLGKDFHVVASYGHIRDLPSKAGSVDPDHRFKMIWEVGTRSETYINNIIKEMNNADDLYLATDPDREGEAISWHIVEMLKEKKALKGKSVSRIVFNEITKSAVQNALNNPRDVNQELVDAYMARRALDYLVGFNISPVLWRKLPGSRSAGRVQSVALRLIVNREREVDVFKPEEYWSILGDFKTPEKKILQAKLTHLSGKKLDKFSINNEALANEAVAILNAQSYSVEDVEKKQVKRNPAAPFITSTLQQEAARKLGFSASRTMQTAQKLYEGIKVGKESTGLITYMRTDGVQLAEEALKSIRDLILGNYGKDYLPKSPLVYKSKAKNAQEAHEAIRPTDITRTPESLRPFLDEGQLKLYDLIWKRTIACQMSQALFDQVSITIQSEDAQNTFKATGSTLVFDGFLRVYQEGTDDQAPSSDEDSLLPKALVGNPLVLDKLIPKQHFTEPPPRYGEASLVKKLEELGIGRPSTYASIIQVLQDRGYVQLEKKQFRPNARGRIVTTFLENYFKRYVEYDFTAHLEEELDEVSDGKRSWLDLMDEFWKPFQGNVQEAMKLDIVSVIDQIKKEMFSYLFGEGGTDKCPQCGQGKLDLRLGKFGAFLGCSNYPECGFTRPLVDGEDVQAGSLQGISDKIIGTDPVTENTILLRKGPYGFYLQWENEFETAKKTRSKKKVEPKPKRISVPITVEPGAVTLEMALFFKSLPIELGIDPDTGEKVDIAVGQYGPYVRMGEALASIPKSVDISKMTLVEAVDLVKKKLARPPRAGRSRKKVTGGQTKKKRA